MLWRRPATSQVATFLGAFNLIAAASAPGTLRRDGGWWALPLDAMRLAGEDPANGLRWRARVVDSHCGQQRVSVDVQTESGDALTLSRELGALPLASGDWIELAVDASALQYLPT